MRLERASWRWYGGLVAVSVVAIILRVHHLGSNSYWLDEAISVLIARLPVPLILRNAGESSHPPLYYLLLHHWIRPSGTEVWVRALSLLWGLLTVPAVFALGKLLFNAKVALLASSMLAIAPLHVFYSQEARMYAQLTCLGVVAVICFWQAMKGGSPYWWLAAAAVVAAAVATHVFAFLLLAAVNLYVLLHQRDDTVSLVLVNVVAIVAVTPHFACLLGQSQHDLGGLRPLAWPDRPTPLFPFTAVHVLLVSYSITPSVVPVAMFCSLVVFVGACWEAVRAIHRRARDSGSLKLLLLVVAITLLGPFGLALIQPMYLPERTLLIALPSMLLLVAWAISEVQRRTPLPVLSIGLVIAMLVSLWGYYFNSDFAKPPFRDVATLVQDGLTRGDAILHTSDGSYLPFLVYLDYADSFLLEGDPDPRKAEAVYRVWGGELVSKGELYSRFERLWLVVALDHSFDFQEAAVAWYMDRYPLLERHEIGGIEVFLMDLTVTKLEDRTSHSGAAQRKHTRIGWSRTTPEHGYLRPSV